MTHSRTEVVRRLTREFRLLDRLVSTLTADEWKQAVPRPAAKDPWTVKDALAHITYWKAAVAREALGKPASPELSLKPTVLNHLVYIRYHRRSAREVLDWHRRVQADLLKALQDAPDEWFTQRGRRDNWPFDLDGHSAEHRINDIQQALAKHAQNTR